MGASVFDRVCIWHTDFKIRRKIVTINKRYTKRSEREHKKHILYLPLCLPFILKIFRGLFPFQRLPTPRPTDQGIRAVCRGRDGSGAGGSRPQGVAQTSE